MWALLSVALGLLVFWAFVTVLHLGALHVFGDLYTSALARAGVSVGLARLEWYASTRSVSRVSSLVRAWPRSSLLFYSCGAFATLLTAVMAAMALLWSSQQQLSFLLLALRSPKLSLSESESPSALLVPLLPGVTVPLRHLLPLVLALLISAVVHEAGHLCAALRVQARVRGFGLMLIALIPAAYVDLPDPLELLSPWRALLVTSAGVWHNLVLASSAFLLLTSAPMLAPLLPYRLLGDEGLTLAHVDDPYVPALLPGDILTALDTCPVSSLSTWQGCVASYYSLNFSQSQGWCIERSALNTLPNATCCDPHNAQVEEDKEELCWDVPSSASYPSPVCARVSALGVSEARACSASDPCPSSSSECAVPRLRGELLMRVHVLRQDGHAYSVLVLAHPYALHAALHVTPWHPRSRSLSLLFPPWLPNALAELLWYVASLSAGLAVLNALPLGSLDGSHILAALLRLTSLNSSQRESLTSSAAMVTAALLAVTALSTVAAYLASTWLKAGAR